MNRSIQWLDSVRVILLIATLFGFLSSAHAHTGLKESSPGDGAVLKAAPEHVQLVFTATVNLVRFDISDQDGRKLDIGFKPDPQAKTEFMLPVPAAMVGHFKAEWAVIGADGHTVTGEFTFAIDPAADTDHGGHHSAAEGDHSH